MAVKINLLPVRAVKKRELGKQQLFLFGLLIAGALIGNYFWYRSVARFSDQLQARIDKTKNEVALLEKTIGEVQNIDKEKKALQDKLAVLDTLRKGRSGPVKLMDELAVGIPTRVWIARFEEGNGRVTMTGSAVSHDDVAQFMKKLKGSKHFKDVVLKGATQRNENEVDWSITCAADYGES